MGVRVHWGWWSRSPLSACNHCPQTCSLVQISLGSEDSWMTLHGTCPPFARVEEVVEEEAVVVEEEVVEGEVAEMRTDP